MSEWTKKKVLKAAGTFNKLHLVDGIERYAVYLRTEFGEPNPWSPEKVQAFLAKIGEEYDSDRHMYVCEILSVRGMKPSIGEN